MSNGAGKGPPPGKGPDDIPGQVTAAQAKLKGAHAKLGAPSSLLSQREELLLGSHAANTTPRALTDREITLLALRLEAF